MSVVLNNKILLAVVIISLLTAFLDVSLRAYASECEGYDVDSVYSECDGMYCGDYECSDQESEEGEDEDESDE